MRVFLLGPRKPAPSFRPTARDFLVAVDGGMDQARAKGWTPTLAIGDWDSISSVGRRRLARIPHLTLPHAKDRSDLFHALRISRLIGATEVVASGFDGGRADHALGALLDFTAAARELELARLELFGQDARYGWVTPRMGWRELAGLKKGREFSLFALDGPALGVSLQGARYPLQAVALEAGSQGLSNVTLRAAPRVRVRAGVLLSVVPA